MSKLAIVHERTDRARHRLGDIPDWPKKRYDFGVIADTRYRPGYGMVVVLLKGIGDWLSF